MFLTNQNFGASSDQPQLVEKTYLNRFTVNEGNLWNNVHRTSYKVMKQYHNREKMLSSSDLQHSSLGRQDQHDHLKQKVTREKEHYALRLLKRRLESEVVQFRSNQPVSSQCMLHLGSLMQQDPEMAHELSMKRSLDFRDPRCCRPDSYNCLNKLPTKAIRQVINPTVLEKDKLACQMILQKIQDEETAEQFNQLMQRQQQMETRQRFLKRHEQNIKREQGAGIKKNYVNLESFQFGGQIILEDELDQSPITSLAMQNSVRDKQFASQKKNKASQDDDVNQIDAYNFQNSQFQELANLTAYNWLNRESNQMAKTFRVTTASASQATCVDQVKVSQRMQRIQMPKKKTVLTTLADPLTNIPQFRGLFLADYKEAIANSFPIQAQQTSSIESQFQMTGFPPRNQTQQTVREQLYQSENGKSKAFSLRSSMANTFGSRIAEEKIVRPITSYRSQASQFRSTAQNNQDQLQEMMAAVESFENEKAEKKGNKFAGKRLGEFEQFEKKLINKIQEKIKDRKSNLKPFVKKLTYVD